MQSSQKNSKGKGKTGGFYRANHHLKSTTVSEDGRWCVTSSRTIPCEAPIPAPESLTEQVVWPAAIPHNSGLEEAAPDPAFDAAWPAEPVEGLAGISVVAKEKAKRYLSSVC